MKNPLLFVKGFLIILPVSLLVGAGLVLIQPSPSWIGWLGTSLLCLFGLALLVAAWRWAGAGRTLAWMIGLAFLLRLAAGVAVYVVLPINGHDAADDKAGYVFTDAHRRDDQAWELAISGKPVWAAFDRTFYTDQYGGLLAFSAVTYRVFSPDVQRPLLIILLASLVAALGVPFFYKATALLWEPGLAGLASWLFVLYPESVLTGGAQMREPFLLTFIAMSVWGFAVWLQESKRSGWWWLAAGIAGILLVSPAMALVLLVVLAGWIWLRGEHRRLPWPVLAVLGGVFILGLLLLAWSLSRQHDFGGASPVAVVLNWFRASVRWVIYELERGSGQIQNVFSKLNPLLQFLFVVGYGVAQPVLPPTFFEPTTLTWHVIGIFRAFGWYLVLPLLLYAPIAAWKTPPGRERRLWLWLTFVSWAWILICAIRAGGDQWDNPRYRLIFFGFEALVAAYAWLRWQALRDSWLPRIIALEIGCVLLFGQWYVARYNLVGIHLPILVVLSLSLILLAAIIVGGWLWDRRRARKSLPGS